MKMWWTILEAQRRHVAAPILAAVLTVTAPVTLAQSTSSETATSEQAKAKPAIQASESLRERLQALLRDRSKSPDERVNEALRMLEREEVASPSTKRATAPFGQEDVDRLPWLDNNWNDTDAWAPFGGRWDPWREMQEMRARMDRMFQQAWRRMSDQARQFGQMAARFSPMGEFEERDDAYIYRFDLPGVNKDEVKVTVENGRLSIAGKRESRVDENRKGFARREIFYGQFRRDVYLPPDAEPAKAKTKLENGVLTIEVPRAKGASKGTKQELKIQ
ncbi:MAG: Hsp20/alpha crystallin family protein [Candidatus Sumerlaeaceae bacterium]